MTITNDNPTSAHRVATPANLEVSRTRTIDEVLQEAHDIAEESGHFRSVTDVVSDDWADVHHRAFSVQLETRTVKLSRQPPRELLNELSVLGFGWGDLARMFGVTVPALRRWRQGESPTGSHRRDIAQLVAFIQILQEDHLVADIAKWMEIPIVSGAPITAIDLYSNHRLNLLLDFASDHLDPESVMTSFEPDWREHYRSDFEIIIAEDGIPSIRQKNQNRP